MLSISVKKIPFKELWDAQIRSAIEIHCRNDHDADKCFCQRGFKSVLNHDDDDDNDDDGVYDKDEADQSPHGSRQITCSQWRTFPTKLQLLIKSKKRLAMQMQLDVQTPVHKEAMKYNE